MTLLNQAQKLSSELSRLRRDIHRHPELSFQETRTAQLVADTLQEIGGLTIKTGIGKTGVVADLGSETGPTIAIRADMDALPIQEETGAEYSSTTPGVMHACGHDAHTAMLLGAAQLLKTEFANNHLAGRVRFLFQPSEETSDDEGLSGAPRMIDEGAMEGVDAVIALHVHSMRPLGEVVAHPGWHTAAVDGFKAWITAAGGHGAFPHEAPDPLWMLGPVLMALHSIVSRHINPMKPAVVSLGQIHGGSTNNVIPHEVYLHGTLRSFDEEVRAQLIKEVERALSIVRTLDGDYRLEVERGYPAGWNDPTVNQWLADVAHDFLGPDSVDNQAIGMGAEDFSYMCQKAPGSMMMIGAAIPDGVARAHHTNQFDIDERCLPIGSAILAETARRFLAGETTLAD